MTYISPPNYDLFGYTAAEHATVTLDAMNPSLEWSNCRVEAFLFYDSSSSEKVEFLVDSLVNFYRFSMSGKPSKLELL